MNAHHDKKPGVSATPSHEIKISFKTILDFIKDLFNIRKTTDREFTLQTILENIPFRGHTAWLLIFSIMVASVGLNANSTPVVIGAMLISPLMGPIMGAGFSIATNDIDTFKKSALNFMVMVLLSVLTSFLYFKLSPLSYASHELLSRTTPTFFDVMIAFFGGLAGIVAITRRGFFNVISGVAIATALMPPLCTAGFGLAIGNMKFFGGAMYLFLINSFYIALATFLVIKYLRFPVVKYLNSVKRRNISRLLYFLAILVMIPSILSFWKMYKAEIYKRQAIEFVKENIQYKGTQIVKSEILPEKNQINLYFIGEVIPEPVIQLWEEKLHETPLFQHTQLNIYQAIDNTSQLEESLSKKLESKILEKLFIQNQQMLKEKEAEIQQLRRKLERIKRLNSAEEIIQISREIKTIYPEIDELNYAPMIVVRQGSAPSDTIPTFVIRWKKTFSKHNKTKQRKTLEKYLKTRMKLDTLRILEVNK